VASNALAGDWFGRGVQFSMDSSGAARKLLVWAWNPNTMPNTGGKAYVFTSADGLTWVESQTIAGQGNVREAAIHDKSIVWPDYNATIGTATTGYPLNIRFPWPDKVNANITGALTVTSTLTAGRVQGVYYADVIGAPYPATLAGYQEFWGLNAGTQSFSVSGVTATFIRLQIWGAGGGGGSGASQDASYTGGNTQTLTGGAGGGSGSYAEITIRADHLDTVYMVIPEGGYGGTNIWDYGNYIAGVNGESPAATVVTLGGVATSYGEWWRSTITVPSGGGGNGGATNVARSGGAAGGTPTSSASAFPIINTHLGVAGRGVSTYNTFPAATNATGIRQASGGGAGGGCTTAGTVVVNGMDSGQFAIPVGSVASGTGLATDRVGKGGIGAINYGNTVGGIGWSVTETGTGSSGGGGGACGVYNGVDGANGGAGGNGGWPAGGGGGGGASKYSGSGQGGSGGSGYVLVTWW